MYSVSDSFSFIGVLLVSLADYAPTESPAEAATATTEYAPLLGDSLALISAFVYALYVTLIKVRVHNESRIDMQLFFGFVGLFNVLLCWPIGLIMHLVGMETLEEPRNRLELFQVIACVSATLSLDIQVQF